MATPTADREAILRTIEAWPVADQVALAQLILRRAADHGAQPQRPSWRQLAGMAACGPVAPSDDDIARLLDEHRSEKHG